MGDRVDLDKAWELASGCAGDFDVDGCELMRAVIAELRAAREVVDAARPFAGLKPSMANRVLLRNVLAAYDEAVTP